MIKCKRCIGGMIVVMSLAMVPLLVACGGNIPIVSEVKVEEGYTDSQIMLIVATERNRYRKVYTDQIWQVKVSDGGMDFREYFLGQIQNFLWELKMMNLLADEQGITLTGQQKEILNQMAHQYYESLSEADLAYTGVEESDVYTMYEAYYRANRLVEELTKEVNLEISDSEAKMIIVQEIKLSDEARAREVYERVLEEGADFAGLARSVSEEDNIEKEVGRSERSKEYEAEVFSLESGQISQVFQDGDQWYIVKCINDYDEEKTLERKQELALQRKERVFRKIYDAFAAEHPIQIQGSLWDEISLMDGAESTTTDFFEKYHDTMEQWGEQVWLH